MPQQYNNKAQSMLQIKHTDDDGSIDEFLANL